MNDLGGGAGMISVAREGSLAGKWEGCRTGTVVVSNERSSSGVILQTQDGREERCAGCKSDS